MDDIRYLALIDEFRRLPVEPTWLDFKTNFDDPDKIGKLVSALSNAARLNDKSFGYIVWGVRDGDHEVIGTTFDQNRRVGNINLDFWLAGRLTPAMDLRFVEVAHKSERLLLLQVPSASRVSIKW
jgi:ATP-dependent DNA helicase RecG